MATNICVETPVDRLGKGTDLFSITGKRYPALAECALTEGQKSQLSSKKTLIPAGSSGVVVACVVFCEDQAHLALFTPSGNALFFCLATSPEKMSPQVHAWWAFARRHYAWICFDKNVRTHFAGAGKGVRLFATDAPKDSLVLCLDAIGAQANNS